MDSRIEEIKDLTNYIHIHSILKDKSLIGISILGIIVAYIFIFKNITIVLFGICILCTILRLEIAVRALKNQVDDIAVDDFIHIAENKILRKLYPLLNHLALGSFIAGFGCLIISLC